jgi:hypothetical protein
MPEEKTDQLPTQVAFHYVKSNGFRTVHGDGMIGSVTPRGLIHFAIYTERPAIPQVVVHELDTQGKVGAIVGSPMGRDGIVRELEVDIVLDLQTAKSFREWLDLRLEEAGKMNAALAASAAEGSE